VCRHQCADISVQTSVRRSPPHATQAADQAESICDQSSWLLLLLLLMLLLLLSMSLQVLKASSSSSPLVVSGDTGLNTLGVAATVHALGLGDAVSRLCCLEASSRHTCQFLHTSEHKLHSTILTITGSRSGSHFFPPCCPTPCLLVLLA
jgi:hypothetical protein